MPLPSSFVFVSIQREWVSAEVEVPSHFFCVCACVCRSISEISKKPSMCSHCLKWVWTSSVVHSLKHQITLMATVLVYSSTGKNEVDIIVSDRHWSVFVLFLSIIWTLLWNTAKFIHYTAISTFHIHKKNLLHLVVYWFFVIFSFKYVFYVVYCLKWVVSEMVDIVESFRSLFKTLIKQEKGHKMSNWKDVPGSAALWNLAFRM